MGPLPAGIAIDPALWPEPAADGTTVLTPEAAGHIFVLLTTLVNYLEEQHAACATTASRPAAD